MRPESTKSFRHESSWKTKLYMLIHPNSLSSLEISMWMVALKPLFWKNINSRWLSTLNINQLYSLWITNISGWFKFCRRISKTRFKTVGDWRHLTCNFQWHTQNLSYAHFQAKDLLLKLSWLMFKITTLISAWTIFLSSKRKDNCNREKHRKRDWKLTSKRPRLRNLSSKAKSLPS